MCLNLRNSQFKNINEVEQLIYRKVHPLTDAEIYAIADDRKTIEKELNKTNAINDIIRLL